MASPERFAEASRTVAFRNCTSRPAAGKLASMNIHELIRELQEANGTKIVLLVADGLGGLPLEPGGKTELETARTPNLDALARDGVCGLSIPVAAGHHARQRPRPPRPVRLRPARIPHRPRHPRSARHQLRSRPAGRRHPRQLLHARTPTARSPTAGPAGRPPSAARRWSRSCGTIEGAGRGGVRRAGAASTASSLVFRGDGLGDAVNDTDPQAIGVAAAAGARARTPASRDDGRGWPTSSSPRRGRC